MDDAVQLSNADWLTSGPQQGREQQSSPGMGEAHKTTHQRFKKYSSNTL